MPSFRFEIETWTEDGLYWLRFTAPSGGGDTYHFDSEERRDWALARLQEIGT